MFPRDKVNAHGIIVALVDTSGSVDDETVGKFIGQCQAVLDEARPEKIIVIDCDTMVNNWLEYEPGDHIEFTPNGGGGTDFRSAFEKIQTDLLDAGDEVAGFVGFSDLRARFPHGEPEYPVLWVSTGRDVAPFGRVVAYDE